jgi:hypothetical protein
MMLKVEWLRLFLPTLNNRDHALTMLCGQEMVEIILDRAWDMVWFHNIE